jgi:fermentation-respiration switch protein FrsA (DUF1100 family)
VRDYRHAITYVTGRDEVDPDRVGVWGSSLSGGHALSVAAVDRRVRAVVAQVPFISGSSNVERYVRVDFLAAMRARLAGERRRVYEGGEPALMPVVDADPHAPSVLPTADSWEFFSKAAQDRAPSWRNEVTVSSLERLGEYEPGDGIHRISPTPLLMIVSADDVCAPAAFALRAYQRAVEPKRLVMLPGGHFDAYTGTAFSISSTAACEHFVHYLT